MTLKNIAVLIDGDNASVATIGQVFEKIAILGKIGCKKIYGDWGQTNLSSWQPAILKHAIDAMQQFSYVKGKNATDIALVIEAMDLLHSGEYDGFCLVSSDSDFASLAVRIRKSGVPVYGFGKGTAVSSFKQACDEFFVVDELAKAVQKNPPVPQNTRWTTEQLQKQTHFISLLHTLIDKHQNDQGWAYLAGIASDIHQNHPQIKLSKYGYAKFSDLMTAFRLFDIKKQQNGILVKRKNAKASQPPHNPPNAQTPNLTSQQQTPLLLKNTIQISIISACPVDAVLWRLTANKNVRGDDDMIFYGQNFSGDESLALSIEQENNCTISTFDCQLNQQPNEIDKLAFTLTSELTTIANEKPIQVMIHQQDECLFSGEFLLNKTDVKSVWLFELTRQANQWQFFPKKQIINGDLRQLCENFGVEVSDE